MIIGSFALAVGGGIALAIPDDEGWISTGPVRMTTDAVALVGDDIEIDLGDHVGDGHAFIGWHTIPARIQVEPKADSDVFIGVARDGDAQAYLAGVATAQVNSFDRPPTLRHHDGARTITPPGDMDIWVASSTHGDLRWDMSEGEWTVVVLNADGSAGVDVALTGSAQVPFLGAIGVVLIALGLIGLTVGTLLTYYGVRRVRIPMPATPPHSDPPPAAATG